jgi:hypothetical protein
MHEANAECCSTSHGVPRMQNVWPNDWTMPPILHSASTTDVACSLQFMQSSVQWLITDSCSGEHAPTSWLGGNSTCMHI